MLTERAAIPIQWRELSARVSRSVVLTALVTLTDPTVRSADAPKNERISETLLSLRKSFPYTPLAISQPETITDDRSTSVILLPKVTVTSRVMPMPDGSNLLTKEGLAELFLKKYPGASFKGQSPTESRAPNYAAMMHKDAVRLQQLNELKDTVEMLERSGRPDEAKKMNEMIYRTFIRNLTEREKAMDRSVNGGRTGS